MGGSFSPPFYSTPSCLTPTLLSPGKGCLLCKTPVFSSESRNPFLGRVVPVCIWTAGAWTWSLWGLCTVGPHHMVFCTNKKVNELELLVFLRVKRGHCLIVCWTAVLLTNRTNLPENQRPSLPLHISVVTAEGDCGLERVQWVPPSSPHRDSGWQAAGWCGRTPGTARGMRSTLNPKGSVLNKTCSTGDSRYTTAMSDASGVKL